MGNGADPHYHTEEKKDRKINDHAGGIYERSEWVTKDNERVRPRAIPFCIQYTFCDN